MYAYREMSRKERLAVIHHRKALKACWHKPTHLTLGAGWYFITAATYEHQAHFSLTTELTALELRLLEAFTSAQIPCAGWVVMPNHYHALVDVDDLSHLGKFLGGVHGRSARYANLRDNSPGRQVWYKFTDRKVRSERHYWTCLHYILCNPVKHGYVVDPMDWPWSCIHELASLHGPAWIDDLKREYALHDFGRGWDD